MCVSMFLMKVAKNTWLRIPWLNSERNSCTLFVRWYYWNDGEYLYKFAADTDDSLWFYNWRFDSLVTLTVLYQAAQEIGGFDETKNLYYDGSWSEHWYAQVRIGNDTRKYTFCPMASSGYIEDTSSRKVNFGDLSKFTRIYWVTIFAGRYFPGEFPEDEKKNPHGVYRGDFVIQLWIWCPNCWNCFIVT